MSQKDNTSPKAKKSMPQKSTSIAVYSDTLTKVDAYCKRYGIAKKDFVELAINWVEENDIDIRSETTFAPVISSTDTHQQDTASKVDALCDLMSRFIASTQTQQKQAIEANNHQHEDEKERLRQRIVELERWKERAEIELKRIEKEQPYFGKLHVRTNFD